MGAETLHMLSSEDPRRSFCTGVFHIYFGFVAAVEMKSFCTQPNNGVFPWVFFKFQEARSQEKERRDASSAGRRGQAERAALAEMNSAVQGKNAADYAAKCKASRCSAH